MLTALAMAVLVGVYVPHDGDSGRLITNDGRQVSIRLAGIDAPETAPFTRCRKRPDIPACSDALRRFGPLATTRARQLAKHGARCVGDGSKSYERLVVTCTAHGRDIGGQLVKEGLAISEVQFGDRYRAQEDAARARRLGAWR
jgi:endonuclease YncB( thermonuclease family)